MRRACSGPTLSTSGEFSFNALPERVRRVTPDDPALDAALTEALADYTVRCASCTHQVRGRCKRPSSALPRPPKDVWVLDELGPHQAREGDLPVFAGVLSNVSLGRKITAALIARCEQTTAYTRSVKRILDGALEQLVEPS